MIRCIARHGGSLFFFHRAEALHLQRRRRCHAREVGRLALLFAPRDAGVQVPDGDQHLAWSGLEALEQLVRVATPAHFLAGLCQQPLVDAVMRGLVEPLSPGGVEVPVLLREQIQEAGKDIVGLGIQVLEQDAPLLVLVVLLPKLPHVADVPQPAERRAELVEGELPVVVVVEALAPSADHRAVLPLAQHLELLAGVDRELLRVVLAGLRELLAVGGVPGAPDLVVEAGLLPLVEGHVQLALVLGGDLLLRLAEHAEVRAAQRQVGGRVEVSERQVRPPLGRLHHPEQLPRVPGVAHLLADLHENFFVDAAAALGVHTLHPSPEHVAILRAELFPQLCDGRVRLGVQVAEGQVAHRHAVDLWHELLPQASDLAEHAQPVQRLRELAGRQASVAVQVQVVPPRAVQGAAAVDERELEALGRVEPRLHLPDLVQLVLELRLLLLLDHLAVLGQAPCLDEAVPVLLLVAGTALLV
mmetsp:Transcript_99422/g.259201  ORF Transcript_99422/g.259201 Transcript_99422/m.259201 type:complete len:472 (+) Transcript_99422:913-2328(+)